MTARCPFANAFDLPPLTILKDDGVVIYGRRDPSIAGRHTARMGFVHHLIHSFGAAAADLRRGLEASWSGWRSGGTQAPVSPKTAEMAEGGQSYLSHASGRRIAGAACVHRPIVN